MNEKGGRPVASSLLASEHTPNVWKWKVERVAQMNGNKFIKQKSFCYVLQLEKKDNKCFINL